MAESAGLKTRVATAEDAALIGALLKLAVNEAEQRGIRVVSLHASKFGKPVYERSGFEPTSEMILWNSSLG